MNEQNRPAHPADVADQLERLPVEEAQQELRDLPAREGAAVLAELDEQTRPALLEALPPDEIAGLVREMPHDQAADLLSELPDDVRAPVLRELPASERQQLSDILAYPPESAGGIMSDRFFALREDMTIDQAHRLLRSARGDSPDLPITYLYVTDRAGKLTGILPVHELVFNEPDRRIGSLMKRDVKHANVEDDQEKIAQLFEHYHYMALPVLDPAGKLLGIVQANQVVEVMRKEATEDMQLMVGLSGEERALSPWHHSIRRRLPWLCINLGTAFLAASVVGLFEETIAAWTALAIFLPIVAGQGGNAGAQALTIIIRDMALGELSPGDGRKALLKEALLGLLNGMIIGILVGLISYLWKQSFLLGVIVGLAMILNLITAGVAGVLVPYTLRTFRVDPALGSTIILTMITDIAGFFFFLGLATLLTR